MRILLEKFKVKCLVSNFKRTSPEQFLHLPIDLRQRGVVRGVAMATPIFQILFHKLKKNLIECQPAIPIPLCQSSYISGIVL